MNGAKESKTGTKRLLLTKEVYLGVGHREIHVSNGNSIHRQWNNCLM